ncbi:preprotein translocase subunit SecG [candidate division KSB1 bacterium]|nr:preprotein translocase subunit SecG [candidate division KSB1 bacterium]
MGFLIFIHILVAFFLVIVILLQSSKGGGLAGAFGGMGGGAVFGGRGVATFLSKVTTVLATILLINCIIIGVIASRRGERESLIQQAAQRARVESPVANLPAVPGTVSPPAEEKPAPTGEEGE